MNSENINNTLIHSDEISLKELILKLGEWWQYLLSKWIIILICGLFGGGLGFAYAYFKKPAYTATTTFVLEDETEGGGGLGSLSGLASMAGVNLSGGGGDIFQGDNILELYKSRKMIEQTLLTPTNYEGKKELLINLYIEFNELRKIWAEKPELSEIRFDSSSSSFTRLQDSILGVVVKDINANYLSVSKPNKKLSIIKADVKSHNEFFAKAFNEQIVKNVNDFYTQTKTKKSLDNVMILQQKTDSVRAVMNGAIYHAAIVADATPNLNPARQVQRTAPVQKSQFSAETNKAVLSALVQNLEMSKIALRKEAPLIQVIDKPILPLEKEQLGKLKSLILGGILGGFLISLVLTFKLFYNFFLNK
jgi:hypothetical protein